MRNPIRAYRAPSWLSGGLRQTIYAARGLPISVPTYRSENWARRGATRLKIKWIDSDAQSPLIVLLPGLTGGALSNCARSLAWACERSGWSLAIPECGSGALQSNSDLMALATALPQVLEELSAASADRPVFALGVSLAALPLLSWLAQGASAGYRTVVAAAAVSAPLELENCVGRIPSEILPLLGRSFERCQAGRLNATARQQLRYAGALGMTGVRDREGLLSSSTLDRLSGLTAGNTWQPEHLKCIATPTLLLNARNDPCLSEACFPTGKAVSVAIKTEYPEQGGHAGFVTGAYPGRLDWLPNRVMRFFASIGSAASPRYRVHAGLAGAATATAEPLSS